MAANVLYTVLETPYSFLTADQEGFEAIFLALVLPYSFVVLRRIIWSGIIIYIIKNDTINVLSVYLAE